jgi:hypothetical protein
VNQALHNRLHFKGKMPVTVCPALSASNKQ